MVSQSELRRFLHGFRDKSRSISPPRQATSRARPAPVLVDTAGSIDGTAAESSWQTIFRSAHDGQAISELKEALQLQVLLAAELQHRMKNTFAIVGAIANQTIRGGDMEAARKAFAARLIALGDANGILTRTNWNDAPVRDVVDSALAPYRSRDASICVNGPGLMLSATQALALAIAVHELATNATKYGSLSARGRVDVGWALEEIGGVRSLRFSWTESGGPAVLEPAPHQKGFGSSVIETVLSKSFDGTVTISYRRQGLACELIAPFSGKCVPAPRVDSMN